MSSNSFFQKWKTVLRRLRSLVELDQEYQDTKTPDKTRCLAAQRLSGVLGVYICIYNEALECLQQNLQVQKTQDIEAVVTAVVNRILELKQHLRKLEGYQPHFLSQALIQHQLTTDDAEFQDVPFKIKREDYIQNMIKESIQRAKEKLQEKELERQTDPESEAGNVNKWWEEEEKEVEVNTKDTFTQLYGITDEKTEETLTMIKMVTLIQAHERNRQVTRWKTLTKLKREIWVKVLEGNMRPPARLDLKVRAAEVIQRVYRAFMETKRKRLKDCQADKLLGMTMCGEISYDAQKKAEEMKLIKERRRDLFEKFERDWKSQCVEIKQEYLKEKRDEICEYYRDNIRDWLQYWYQKIKLFHDIPADNKGGSAVIIRGEIPSPEEWLQQYKAYLEDKKKNKDKSAQQKNLERVAAKQEAMNAKKEQQLKKKLEEQLMKKMLKNPNLHPGYRYPQAKKTSDVIQALDHYHAAWDDLDASETIEVKERYIKELDKENMYMEAKLEVIPQVDEDMRKELKKLEIALKHDYENEGEELPIGMKEKQRAKKKKKVKAKVSGLIAEKMEQLVEKGILKEYPRTKLEDFIGDHNFAGDGLRCLAESALPYPGEIRNIWWERCREVALGFRRVLVVGPMGSGRSTLVHAMATANDAVLFELDPKEFDDELISPLHLQHVVTAVANCARAAQPAVIFVKEVQRLFYKRAPADNALSNSDLIRQYLIGKLIKKIQKNDKITIIGSCSDPWLAKSAKLLKHFPEVVLMPDTSYSVVVQLVNTWITNNHSIPSDFDAHSLARMLRGYGFAFIKETLEHFLQPEQVVKMAAHGLFAMEVYDYVLQTAVEKSDYEKYLKWYTGNTFWGKKEKQQLEEAREFRALAKKYEDRKKKAPPSRIKI